MGHQVCNHQSGFPGLEGPGAVFAGSSPPSSLSSQRLKGYLLPSRQTPNKDVLGKATGQEGLKALDLGLRGWPGDPKKLRKEEVGLQGKQLILFLNKPPVMLLVGRGFGISKLRLGLRVHHLSCKKPTDGAHGQHGTCAEGSGLATLCCPGMQADSLTSQQSPDTRTTVFDPSPTWETKERLISRASPLAKRQNRIQPL